jgi:hypothetical protein
MHPDKGYMIRDRLTKLIVLKLNYSCHGQRLSANLTAQNKTRLHAAPDGHKKSLFWEKYVSGNQKLVLMLCGGRSDRKA